MTDFFAAIKKPPLEKPKKLYDTDTAFFTEVKQLHSNNHAKSIKPKLNDNGDYNILALYEEVLNRLKTEKPKPEDDKDQIEIQQWIAENDPDPTERRMAKERLFEITNKKGKKNNLEEFTQKAAKILDEYRELCREPVYIDFVARKIIRSDVTVKLRLVAQDFICMCNEYVPISLTAKFHKYTKCCEDPTVICEDNTNYCGNCGEIVKTLDQAGAYKDQKRVSSSTRQKYYNVKHFETALKKVQGIHKKEIPESVFRELDAFRARRKMSTEEFTIENLNYVLSMNRQLAQYYKDIHLIYRLYTGIQLINLADVEDRVKEMYCEQDKLSSTIKLKDESKNSINATYMCCRLSQFAGRNDLRIAKFFCTKTPETIEKYDEVMEIRARKLGWLLEGEEFLDVCK